MPRVFLSVLIDTYNHERYIEAAISSVLEQDFPAADREVLVVDDGSSDRTPDIVAKFAGVRLLRKANGGQATAFNYALPQCRGEIVAMLDGDDWWAPTKLSAIASAFSEHPNVGLIGHSITEVLSDGTQRSELVRESPRFRIDSAAGARLFRLRKSFLGTSRMAFRSNLLQRIGPAPEALVIQADEFLFTLGSVYSEVLLLREPLTFYRLHGHNLFQISSGDQAGLRRKHAVLAALADALQLRLDREQVAPEISRIVVDAIRIEAAALRLALGEGSPLENFRSELRSYELHHQDASIPRRFLKCISLLPALFLSTRNYNSLKQQLVANSFYRKLRERVLPYHRPTHVDRSGNWNR